MAANTGTCTPNHPKLIGKDRENGIRTVLLQDLGRERLQHHFHLYFPEDPVDLYNALWKYQTTFEDHKKSKKKILKQDQYDKFPSNGETFSDKFDITLLFYLLRTCCNLIIPKTGWKKIPKATDNSNEANFVRIKILRNQKQHMGTIEMTEQELATYYADITKPLLALGCSNIDIKETLTCEIDNALKIQCTNEIRRANQAEAKARCEKDRADKLECSKKNIIPKLLPKLPTFIGRDDEMNALQTMMENLTDNQLGIVICGMGGVGKSEFARAFANDNKSKYDNNVLWINGESESTIESSFLDIAQFIGLSIKQKLQDGISEEFISSKVIVQRVYRFFEDKKCLFIFDNVNKKEGINDFTPQSNSGDKKPAILITSQYSHWESYFEILHIDVFSEKTACDFLNSNEKHQQSDQKAREDLCKLLGYHPFALQNAISYTAINGCTYSKYASLFTKSPNRMMERSPVLATIQVALSNILTNYRNEKMLHKIIEFIPFLDGKEIKKGFLMQLFDQDEIGINRALSTLQSFSLITMRDLNNINEDEQTIIVHSLVQQAILITESTRNDNIKSLHDLFNRISKTENSLKGKYSNKHLAYICVNELTKEDTIQVLKNMADPEIFMLCEILFENYHFIELISITIKLIQPKSNRNYRSIMLRFKALSYMNLGKYKECLEHFESLEAVLKEMYEENDKVFLDTQNNIGACYYKMEYFEKALICFNKVQTINKQNYGEEHPNSLRIQCNIATCYQSMGKEKKALELHKRIEACLSSSMSVEKGIPGEEHRRLLSTQSNIASCYQDMGNFKKALKQYKEVEKKQNTISANDDNDLLLTRQRIASCYLCMNKYEEALQVLKAIEPIQKRVLGEMHSNFLMIQSNIASCFRHMGHFKKSIEIFKEIETKQKMIFEDEDLELLKTRLSIALSYSSIRELKNASEMYENVKMKGKVVLDHPDFLTIQSNIALCYIKMGKFKKAFELLKKIETKQRVVLADEHPDLLKTQHSIALCYEEMGQLKEALDRHEIVELKQKTALGEEHPDFLNTQSSIASCYLKIGQFKKALELHKTVEIKKKLVLGDGHRDFLETQHSIALCYMGTGQLKEALETLENVKTKQEKLFGEDHPNSLGIQHSIASCYYHMGQFKKALELLKNLEIKEKISRGEEHPTSLATQQLIASCYMKTDQPKDALEILECVKIKQEKVFGEDNRDSLITKSKIAACHLVLGQFRIALELFKKIETPANIKFGEKHQYVLGIQRSIEFLLQLTN